MVDAVRTPLHYGGSLALGQHKFRKEILIKGPLHVNGQTFDVSDAYLDEIKRAFDAGAIRSVPVQLAPDDNSHSEDLSRRRGRIVGVSRTARGLDADVELNDEAAAMISEWPDTGVSVLVKHDRTTGEGSHFDAALAHLLITADPVLTTLQPWTEAIAASHDGGSVLDLLALSTAGITKEGPVPDDSPATDVSEAEIDGALALLDAATASPSSDEGAPDPSQEDEMPTLADLLSDASEDELRDLRTKLDAISPTENAVTEDDVEITDAEIDEALALVDLDPENDDDTNGDESQEEEFDESDVPEAIAASHGVDHQIALANAQLSEQLNAQGLELSQMRARVNESDWADRKTFYAQASVPGYLVERAKPFLHGNDTSLKLSQNDKAQAAKLVDSLLLEFGGTLQRLGLAQGVVGSSEDTSADAAATDARVSAVSSALAAHGAVPAARRTTRGPQA